MINNYIYITINNYHTSAAINLMSQQLVKVVASDIKSQKLKTLMTNIARFALQNVINLPPYKDKVQEKSFELSELMKISHFKKELVF